MKVLAPIQGTLCVAVAAIMLIYKYIKMTNHKERPATTLALQEML
jgi:hypothetical protein